jgi:protein transport protein SEC24
MNPFVTFLSHGRRWRCNMCFRVDNVPDDYDYDPVTRQHVERSERPELNFATVEYIAPSE